MGKTIQVRRGERGREKKRSVGALALRRLGFSQREIGARIGVGAGLVSMWMSGERTPGLENRQAVLTLFGVAIEAWDQYPPAAPQKPAAPPPDSWGKGAVEARIEKLQETIDLLLNDARDPTAAPLERAKVVAVIAPVLGQVRKLRGEDVKEASLLRLPSGRRTVAVLVDSIKDCPRCPKKAGEALLELDHDLRHG